MRSVTIGTADVVAPVLATPEVIPFLFACVARKTGLGRFFRRLVPKAHDLGGIAFVDVVLSGTVTSFAAGDLALPTANPGKLGMRSMRVRFELIFVTVFAGVTADIAGMISILDLQNCGRLRLGSCRTNGL